MHPDPSDNNNAHHHPSLPTSPTHASHSPFAAANSGVHARTPGPDELPALRYTPTTGGADPRAHLSSGSTGEGSTKGSFNYSEKLSLEDEEDRDGDEDAVWPARKK